MPNDLSVKSTLTIDCGPDQLIVQLLNTTSSWSTINVSFHFVAVTSENKQLEITAKLMWELIQEIFKGDKEKLDIPFHIPDKLVPQADNIVFQTNFILTYPITILFFHTHIESLRELMDKHQLSYSEFTCS